MDLEITVMLQEDGTVTIKKSNEMGILEGIGILALAKKIMLENGDSFQELEEETDIEPVEVEIVEGDEDEDM